MGNLSSRLAVVLSARLRLLSSEQSGRKRRVHDRWQILPDRLRLTASRQPCDPAAVYVMSFSTTGVYCETWTRVALPVSPLIDGLAPQSKSAGVRDFHRCPWTL
jgi:hypothetical protein